MNRQLFRVSVVRFERKRYQKSVGLPYSEVVVIGGSLGEKQQAVLRYNHTLHSLSLKRHDEIEFSAILTNKLSRGFRILQRPTKIKKVNIPTQD